MMKRLAALVLCLAVAAADARAQDSPEPKAPISERDANRLHDELRSLASTMEKALNERDIATITSRVTEDVVFTTMNGDVVRGRLGIRAYFVKMMEGPDRVVEKVTSHFVPDDLSILLDDHTAVAFGRSEDHYVLTNGTAMDIQARWSGTMVHRSGKWDIASFHYSANVFDNPILLAQRKLLILVLGGLVVVVALIAFLVGKRLGKRSPA
jgi:uncharacterized protein (TIGR02246 family)